MNTEHLESLESGEGTVLYYDNADDIKIPLRSNFITEINITGQRLYFMPNDMSEVNRSRYILKVYGVLINGQKIEVNITDIDMFFDVGIPDGINPDRIHNDLHIMFQDVNVQYRIETVQKKPLYGFYTEKKIFKRVHTNNMFSRLKLLNIVNEQMKLKTYSNDNTHYYRKAARENKLSLSDWVYIENYEYDNNVITVHKNNYIRVTDKNNDLIRDKTLVMAWDIETYSNRRTGEVPSPEHEGDNVFMICITYHWLHNADALYKICLVDKDTRSDSRWTTIVCKNQVNILKAFAICWNHFKPDICIGFNDSGYDWPFVIEKSINLNILPWMWEKMTGLISTTENIIRYNYNNRRERNIKINAEVTFTSRCPTVPGTVLIDCLPCFMKIYPRLEMNKYGTLKFYLKDNNLPTKVDLPIPVLWRYYESGDINNMREIAYYCIVDTISVQRLFVKRNIVTDYREVATLAYMNLSDSHYYAGGCKVCNLLGAYAHDLDIVVNMIRMNRAAEKYPGAYVFPPDKGMTPNIERLKDLKYNENKELAIANFAKDRPVSCLDFASLYPSLIMTYNLSPEKILLTKDEYDQYCNTHKLHTIEFDVGSRHIQAWSVMHKNKQENMGLFPIILQILFSKRKEMKGLLKKLSDKKELYELIFNSSIQTVITNFKQNIEELSKEIIFIPPGSSLEEEQDLRKKRIKNIQYMLSLLDSFNKYTMQEDYESVCFERNCIDKKQGALKIYMNTFYGETGNNLSPFFLLELAGGVTSAGQTNIKLAANYAKSNGFNIKYGDTDSLYLTCPNKYFMECDYKYISGEYSKEDYFTAMVKITLRVIANFEHEINDYLEQNNGTKFLKMENEGCYYPCLFLGKKKYFGIQHVNDVNFNPKKLYIKGIEVIKQGKSNIEKEIGNTIMKQAVSLSNESEIIDIVKNILHDSINSDQWKFEDFVQMATWKPTKDNKSVQSFMKRMSIRHSIELRENERLVSQGLEPKQLLYKPLDPGEKFSYVLVKSDLLYDLKGNKIAIKAGDLMEYSHIAKQENMSIDIVYYLIHYVIGICARFISSDEQFMPNIPLDDKKLDDYNIKMAKSFLEKYVKTLSGISQQEITQKGKECKLLFKNALRIYSSTLPIQLQPVLTGPLLSIAFTKEDEEDIDIIVSNAYKCAESIYKKHFKTFCIDLCILNNINPDTGSTIGCTEFNATNLYKQISLQKSINSLTFNKIEYNIRKKFKDLNINDMIVQYKTDISYIIDKIKNDDTDYVDFNANAFNEFVNNWHYLISLQLYRIQNKEYLEYLENLKRKRTGTIKQPSKKEITELVNEVIKNK